LFVVASAKSDQTSDLRKSTLGSGWPESSQPNWQFWTKKQRTLSHASSFIKEIDQLTSSALAITQTILWKELNQKAKKTNR
jgi:hypothetical protein